MYITLKNYGDNNARWTVYIRQYATCMHVIYNGIMKVYRLNFPWAQGASLDGLGKCAVPSTSKYPVAVYNRGMAKA
jgi:hypothetical protein